MFSNITIASTSNTVPDATKNTLLNPAVAKIFNDAKKTSVEIQSRPKIKSVSRRPVLCVHGLYTNSLLSTSTAASQLSSIDDEIITVDPIVVDILNYLGSLEICDSKYCAFKNKSKMSNICVRKNCSKLHDTDTSIEELVCMKCGSDPDAWCFKAHGYFDDGKLTLENPVNYFSRIIDILDENYDQDVVVEGGVEIHSRNLAVVDRVAPDYLLSYSTSIRTMMYHKFIHRTRSAPCSRAVRGKKCLNQKCTYIHAHELKQVNKMRRDRVTCAYGKRCRGYTVVGGGKVVIPCLFDHTETVEDYFTRTGFMHPYVFAHDIIQLSNNLRSDPDITVEDIIHSKSTGCGSAGFEVTNDVAPNLI